jgi:integrase
VSALARSRWGDVEWELNRITVRSPKTEHHEGKESRVIPLFAELLPQLVVVWNEAEEGTEFVIARYRGRNSNLRTQLERIIRKAGFTPRPKLFQNLRSTWETELAAEFPIHVVCDWVGNTQAVAAKHYLQTTDDHFDRATQKKRSSQRRKAGEIVGWHRKSIAKTPRILQILGKSERQKLPVQNPFSNFRARALSRKSLRAKRLARSNSSR